MSDWMATKKQQGYYKALTGQWLPRGCSKSKASALIEKAKKGEGPKKVISVSPYQLIQAGLNGRVSDLTWEVQENYYPVKTFSDREAARQYALGTYGRIDNDSDAVRQVSVD